MRKAMVAGLAGLGMAAMAAPAVAGPTNFQIKAGDITGEGGKLDKKSGQQWVPIISWEWREFVAPAGAAKVQASLDPQGYYDRGSMLVNGQFVGCEVGKAIPEAVLKTPGVRYTLQDVVIVRCRDTNMIVNYGKIRSSAAW
jgi:hypothetical protein